MNVHQIQCHNHCSHIYLCYPFQSAEQLQINNFLLQMQSLNHMATTLTDKQIYKFTNLLIIRNLLLFTIFNFFNRKNFFWPIWSVAFCKKIFIFWYSHVVTNFKSRIFSLFSTSASRYVLDLIPIRFILIVLWYAFSYLSTVSSNLSIYTFF